MISKCVSHPIKYGYMTYNRLRLRHHGVELGRHACIYNKIYFFKASTARVIIGTDLTYHQDVDTTLSAGIFVAQCVPMVVLPSR